MFPMVKKELHILKSVLRIKVNVRVWSLYVCACVSMREGMPVYIGGGGEERGQKQKTKERETETAL